MKKTINKYWPMVKEMSQVTLLLGVFLFAAYKGFSATDVEVQKMWGGVAIAAFLFSIVPMYCAMVKSLLPKGK